MMMRRCMWAFNSYSRDCVSWPQMVQRIKYFNYELCTLPREIDKPALADALWKLVRNENEMLPDTVHNVLDGGALL